MQTHFNKMTQITSLPDELNFSKIKSQQDFVEIITLLNEREIKIQQNKPNGLKIFSIILIILLIILIIFIISYSPSFLSFMIF